MNKNETIQVDKKYLPWYFVVWGCQMALAFWAQYMALGFSDSWWWFAVVFVTFYFVWSTLWNRFNYLLAINLIIKNKEYGGDNSKL